MEGVEDGTSDSPREPLLQGEPPDALFQSMRRDGSVRPLTLSRRHSRKDARLPMPEEEGSLPHRVYEDVRPSGLGATLLLAYGSIGVVFGDLGTSTLYCVNGIFAAFPNTPADRDIVGAISLIFWTLTLIALVKYVLIVMNADDNGEGGTFALYSLLCRHGHVSLLGSPTSPRVQSHLLRYNAPNMMTPRARTLGILERSRRLRRLLLVIVLLATSMILGDGVLTPAITVLSAVQGIQVKIPSLGNEAVLAITCIIMVFLFGSQRFGTRIIGFAFSPITILWLLASAAIGIYNLRTHGLFILTALSPHHILTFFLRNGRVGFSSLCGAILCVTGTEALFADLGHYSRPAIQLAFTGFIYPCLLINYFGQGAYLLSHPDHTSDAFWKSTPAAVFWPMLGLATLAGIVASQALISGAFSLVKQSMSLKCFPRVRIIHTSKRVSGQVYIPFVNYLMAVLTISVVLIFQDSTRLGNAYGLAVASVMLLTTLLTTLVSLIVWEKGIATSAAFLLVFGTIEGAFLGACLPEIPQGAWFPILLAVLFLAVMYMWFYGAARKVTYDLTHRIALHHITALLNQGRIVRVPGLAIYYTETTSGVPAVLAHAVTNLRALHEVIVFLNMRNVPVPHLREEDRFEVVRTSMAGVYRVMVHYGYFEFIDHGPDFIDHLIEAIDAHLHHEATEEHLRLAKAAGQEPPPPVPGSTLQSVAAVVEGIWRARDDGLVYVMSRSDVEPHGRSSWFKILMLQGYQALKAFSYTADKMCAIPQSQLIEVGMIYVV